MKDPYDFSQGKRGPILPPGPQGKARITLRIDEDILAAFYQESEQSGGAIGYQTLIDSALRPHIEGNAPKFQETLRRIAREEIRAAG